MNRIEAMWISNDNQIFEHVWLYQSAEKSIADGWIVHSGENGYRIHYNIEVDASWRTRKMEITKWGEQIKTMQLHSDGNGHWSDHQGNEIPDLTGCIDVDLYASPFTNTVAIQRLALQTLQSQTINVVFVGLPELKTEQVRQKYTMINEGLYRYEGLETGFTTELPVDSNHFVIDYPDFFHRIR
jgi:uncharacterized protein